MKTQEFEGGAAGTRTMPVYQALAEDLKAMGVDTVFGLMSDDTAAFAVTLDAMGIGLIGARHENVAIGMADGYAAATGRLGVVCVGRGPALANGLQAASFAARTGNPVLIIYGEAALPGAPTNSLGPDYKSLDGPGVLKAAGVRALAAHLLLDLIGVAPVVAVLVVGGAGSGVRQHLVRGADLLEALFGLGVARVHVRVVLAGELAEGIADVFLGCRARDAEDGVVVRCHARSITE
jgi:hypothetical protein